ncbi:MAG: hypothetical protein ABIH41_01095 [Nanoarchaeota archaeon]
MISPEKVLEFVRLRGPVVPSTIRKALGADTMIIGAMLSDLKSQDRIHISSLKVGGSPAYYTPGTEARLETLKKYLNEKEQRALDLLKAQTVLQDSELTPLMRVAMRAIKDFAKSVEVTANGQKHLFWKWHLLANTEAEQAIRRILNPPSPVNEEAPTTKTTHTPITSASSTRTGPQATIMPPPPATTTTAPVKTAPPPQDHPPAIEATPPRKAPPAPKAGTKAQPRKEVQESLEPAKEKPVIQTEFMTRIEKYFTGKSIKVIERTVIKKDSEVDYIIEIPSPVGTLKYYCKAKSKKKPNENDLSSAYVVGEHKHLPVLFVTLGTPTKRAKDMLQKELNSMRLVEL